ncbi:RNA polymerase sigma factor [Orbus wheelerorum]|uniref:RNA polymerase sigma factor n=1 Tax=Orbus wheelerorum TaxID=3074111 RepID=UPI00370D2B46
MIKNTEHLIQAARSGDKQALSELLIVCQTDIKRFARRTCSTSEDVEDAVQIALWQLHRKIGTLKTIATFASWLFRIIERECYRLFKARHTTKTDDDVNLDDIHSPIIDIDLRIDLINLIIRLPPIYRQILIMRDIEEFTAPEVAKKLGISIEAVKSRLHRARIIIKEELDARSI